MQKVLVGVAVSVFVLLLVCTTSCCIVQGGYVGVKRSFGKIQEDELKPGIHFLIPFVNSVASVDTKMRSFEVATEASSKDLQSIQTKVSLQHNLQAALAAETYEAIGDLEAVDERIIAPAASEVLKAVTAQYTAEELITKRAEVKQKITDGIQEYVATTFEKRGLAESVHIDNVAITDFNFSAEFNASIEGKVKAEQEALRAENEKKKKITEAEASAKQVELEADALSYKIKAESTERANAIQREAEALAQNPLLIQLRAVEAWDGKLPSYFGGQMPLPIMGVNTLKKESVEKE